MLFLYKINDCTYMKRTFIFLLLAMILSENIAAQELSREKYLKDKHSYIEGIMQDEMYSSVWLETSSVISAILTNKPNVDGLVKEYEEKYPHSVYLSLIRFYYSEYYFKKSNYSKSLEILNNIKGADLQKDDRSKYIFNKAYCNMRVGNNDDAVVGFENIITLGVQNYINSSNYYLGYINYLSKDFKNAIPYFYKVEESPEFGLLSQYYILESNLMLKRYDEVTMKGEALYRKMNYGRYGDDEDIQDTRNKVARILSEAYYAKDMVREAKNYMDIYSASVGSLTRKENYYMGVVAYSLNSYYSAIDALSKVTPIGDSISQSADFFIASSYLKLKNKVKALEYYKSASENSVDYDTQEEAFFNYAKLTFDLYRNITVFEDYIDYYPSTGRSDEIYYYISTDYLLSKDYQSAIDAISKIRVLKPDMVANYQKASFFRAMSQFENGAYSAALESFQTSYRNSSQNLKLKKLTEYWLAETYYRLHDYQQSSELLSTLVLDLGFKRSKEYNTALYNLGYSYFNGREFDKAVNSFNNYLALPPSKRTYTREAQLRVADSYFMQKDYDRASELYELVSRNNYNINDTYAAYQSAISYGLLGRNDKKISVLDRVVKESPNSPLYSMSVYELGRSYVKEDEYNSAKNCFDLLVKQANDSLYYSKSLLELGMIYSNEANYDKAFEYYDFIVKKNPYSVEAQDALVGLESMYQLQSKPDEYLAYLDKAGLSYVKSDKEKEIMYFNSAEQLFLKGNFAVAYNDLKKFINNYPNGEKLPQAYFYLGETLAKLNKPEEAAKAYRRVMDMGEEGAFAELSTLYYASLCYSMEDYEEASMAYETLSNIAKLDNNKYEALLGIMRSNYYGKNYSDAINAALTLLVSEGAKERNGVEADYIIAKSYLALGRRNDALPVLEKLSKNAMQEEGAESAFILIQYKYDEGDFAAVEDMVYAFSDTKTPHNYWLAMSFIVLGDTFAERDEWEQAVATFESVRDGYTPTGESDDVLEQVEMRLNKIKENEVQE